MIGRESDSLHNQDSYPEDYNTIVFRIRNTVDVLLADDPLFNGLSFKDMDNGYIAVFLYSKDMGPHPITHAYLDKGFQGANFTILELVMRWERDSLPEHKEYLKTYILKGIK